MPAAQLDPAVETYLKELELELKQVPGIVPENVLADFRKSLQTEADRSQLSSERLLDHFRSVYGPPAEQAAAMYGGGIPLPQRGFAPGWRICCSTCGRSAPLDRWPAVRWGARSRGKFILGFCRGCRWLRWMRVVQDLDQPTLTIGLGAERSPEDLRASLPNPWRVIATIVGITLVLVVGLNALAWGILWLIRK